MESEAFKANAVISLNATADGGLIAAFPAPTRSLLLAFAGTMVGASIDSADRDAFAPGDAHVPVTLRFWADDAARMLAVPGSGFDLWYAGRVVGFGRVEQALPAGGGKV